MAICSEVRPSNTTQYVSDIKQNNKDHDEDTTTLLRHDAMRCDTCMIMIHV